MEWISVEKEEPDPKQMMFLLGKDSSIFIRGTEEYPFFFQIVGEAKLLMNFEWTHWMPFPKIPE